MNDRARESDDRAAKIQRKNWRQGSVFRPPGDAPSVLPDYLRLAPGEWLVICTQSCSVCSRNFEKEPLVEVLVAKPLPRYNPSHGDAQGKTGHTFHLPIEGLPGAQALECQLGRRAFIPRTLLLDWTPSETWLAKDALDAFKGWLANYYMRIALPDELANRLHAPGGIREIVREILERDIGGRRAEEGVASFYIRISSDDDLPPTTYYEIELLAVCRDDETREFLDREMAILIGTESDPLSVGRVIVKELTIETMDNVTFANLDGKSRFNDWDDISRLPERLGSLRAAV